MESWCPMGWCHVVNMAKSKCGRLIIWWAGRTSSPGVDGQKGLRLQFNSRQSPTVDTDCHWLADSQLRGLSHLVHDAEGEAAYGPGRDDSAQERLRQRGGVPRRRPALQVVPADPARRHTRTLGSDQTRARDAQAPLDQTRLGLETHTHPWIGPD
eukprot:1188593-Prorocentrum_minimum.AAC.1